MLNAIRRLFGGKGDQETAATPPVGTAVEYKGYSIQPLAMRQAGGFLTAGLITLETPEGGRREHRFVRADTHPSADEAREFTIMKAQRLIDEQGERLFGAEA